MSAMTTTERPSRRRNAGAGDGPNQVPRRKADEKKLRRMAKMLAERDQLYRDRDALIVQMYDHGYTHAQIAALINAEASEPITYDAVGRIIRIARADGADI